MSIGLAVTERFGFTNISIMITVMHWSNYNGSASFFVIHDFLRA